MYNLDILHPVADAQGDHEISNPAPRPSSLDGLNVGLVWNAKRGGLEALDRTGELISNRYSGVTVRRYEGSQPCREDLLKQAIAESDVIVGSTGD